MGEEIRTTLLERGVCMSAKEAAEVVAQVDSNKDGNIDFEEFCKIHPWDADIDYKAPSSSDMASSSANLTSSPVDEEASPAAGTDHPHKPGDEEEENKPLSLKFPEKPLRAKITYVVALPIMVLLFFTLP